MNEATTKLAALQVSQQLGVQALSISHSKARLILKLFEL
jgi:flagellin